MKPLLAILLCVLMPAGAEELQLSVISRSTTHADLWKAAEMAFQRAGVTAAQKLR